MSLVVKICGLSTPETLGTALDAGADMVGFVFFPPSPRNLSLETGLALSTQAGQRAEKVVLLVDAADAFIADVIDAVHPDWLQLHGKETPARLSALKQRFGLPIMKALPIEIAEDLKAVDAYAGTADRLLFDARAPKEATRPGGLGKAFDWTLLRGLDLPVPFMLSGGLTAANVTEAVRITTPFGVDVSSGVERAPGIKDNDMIRAFIAAARAAETSTAA